MNPRPKGADLSLALRQQGHRIRDIGHAEPGHAPMYPEAVGLHDVTVQAVAGPHPHESRYDSRACDQNRSRGSFHEVDYTGKEEAVLPPAAQDRGPYRVI